MRFRSSAVVSPAALHKAGFPYWKQFIVSGCYTGLSPFASGTVASAVAALVYFIPGCSQWWVLIAIAGVSYAVGVPLAGQAEEHIGEDPSFVTLDEFSGQWLALASPIIAANPWWVLLSFLLFRFYDVAKVFPANVLDRKRGGVGIMSDDIIAGLYANLSAHALWIAAMWIIPINDFLMNR